MYWHREFVFGAFALAGIVGVAATYQARALGTRFRLVDEPDSIRKTHDRAVPRIGGVGVFVAVIATILTCYWAAKRFGASNTGFGAVPLWPLMGAGTAVFLLGLADDLFGIPARSKFLFEIAVALALYSAGIRIETLLMPDGGHVVIIPWLSVITTVVWIVGVTNAFNLIDGSDGVAAGAALFASSAMSVVSLLNGQMFGVLVGLAMAGAVLGFLFFNFPPASIFLGDSGSLFIGFMLGTLGLMTTQKASATLALAIPVVSCGLPILDTFLAMGRRFLRRQGMFSPDRGHIHHRLRDLGHSPRMIALSLYAVCAGFALLSLVLVRPGSPVIALLFILAGGVVGVLVQRLHIPEILEVRRVFLRTMQQRSVIAANIRIREAIENLNVAKAPRDVTAALMSIVQTGEFALAELWLPTSYGARFLAESGSKVTKDDGIVWRHTQESYDYGATGRCELRLSLLDASGHRMGRVSFWLSEHREHVYADLSVITRDFPARLNAAILRVASNRPDVLQGPQPRPQVQPSVNTIRAVR